MSAQSALSLFAISDVDLKNVSLLHEPNLLTRRYSERASRSQIRIQGVGGSTIYLAEVDPLLTVDISGWMLTRGGMANPHPGKLLAWDVIANWRNGASAAGEEDHFGWDVAADAARGFVIREPTVTRTPGSLSEVSLQLVLECTAIGEAGGTGGGTLPPTNPPNPPSVTTVWLIATIYTDKGTFQQMIPSTGNPLDRLFGSDIGPWNEETSHRPISSIRPEDHEHPVESFPPYNVLGVNIQGGSDSTGTVITGSGGIIIEGVDGGGGVWVAGDAAEVTGGGVPLKPSGTDVWVFMFGDGSTLDRSTCDLVTGNYPTESYAIASYSPPKTRDDFAGIWKKGTGWIKELDPPNPQLDPISIFT